MADFTDSDTLTLALEGRIDTANAAAWEERLLGALDETPATSLILDAERLKYISSAGLRILMKLAKRIDHSLIISNVSPEVYNIFDVTGFSQLLEVHKALREISVEGCTVIGAGATATVYRIDPETIVKVFNPQTPLTLVQREIEQSKRAFLAGIPTAISYDLVKVGDCYGTVYELLSARDFLEVLQEDSEHFDDHIRAYARTIRKMHEIEVDTTEFPSVKKPILTGLPILADSCTPDELAKISSMIESIPDRNTFVHGDCHPGNVMVQDGEFVFIDLMTSGSGHPIFDLTSMCIAYSKLMSAYRRPGGILMQGHTIDEGQHVWDVYLSTYLETDDEELLSIAERQIAALISVRMLIGSFSIKGLLDERRFEGLKRLVIDYVDEGLKPIVF